MLGGKRLPDRLQIIAGIQPFRNLADVLAERLAIAQERRAREHIDLRAGIVDVIFAGDVIARERQQACQRIAEHRAPAVADMHRPGRIGRDIFDIDLFGRADSAAAIGIALAQTVRSASAQTCGFRVRLMKPGPATSTLSISSSARSLAAICSARSRGFALASFASTIAALVAMSPWEASRGGSTTTRDRSAFGHPPSAASAAQAACTRASTLAKRCCEGAELTIGVTGTGICRTGGKPPPNANPGSSQKASDARSGQKVGHARR